MVQSRVVILFDKVGDILFNEAMSVLRCQNRAMCDALVRSAVNRYYYQCFLSAREVFVYQKPNAKVPGHAEFPVYFEKSLFNEIKKNLSHQAKYGLMSRREVNESKKSILAKLSSISSYLNDGYSLRVAADYRPEVEVNVNSPGVVLFMGNKVSDMKHWPVKVKMLSMQIIAELKKMGM